MKTKKKTINNNSKKPSHRKRKIHHLFNGNLDDFKLFDGTSIEPVKPIAVINRKVPQISLQPQSKPISTPQPKTFSIATIPQPTQQPTQQMMSLTTKILIGTGILIVILLIIFLILRSRKPKF